MTRSTSARRHLAGLLVAAATAGSSLLAAAPASAALTGPEMIAFLNAQRAAHGIPSDIEEVPAWSDGCVKHMNWVKFNGLGHYEKVGEQGYTPEGEEAGRTSVLTIPGDAFSASGVNAFEQAPIHLMQMLSPFVKRSGAGGGCLATLRDRDRMFPATTTFSYPGDGTKNVPVSEVQFEGPFVPAAAVGLNEPGDTTRSKRIGPSLYFYYASAAGVWNSDGTITAATLTGPAGAVEVKWVDNTTAYSGGGLTPLGAFLAGGGILMPTAPLTAGTTYTASVTFDPDGAEAPVSRTWSFTTAGTAPAGSGTPGGGTGTPGGSTPGGSTPVTPVTPVVTPVTPPATVPGKTPLPQLPADVANGLTVNTGPAGFTSPLRLRQRFVSFRSPVTGRHKLVIAQETKSKTGAVKTTVRFSKTITIATTQKSIKLTWSKKKQLKKGKSYVVTLQEPGSGKVLVRSVVKVK